MHTGGFELASSALTSSTLKWLHRIQCGFNVKNHQLNSQSSLVLKYSTEIIPEQGSNFGVKGAQQFLLKKGTF
jgi:hypothetical protein